MVKKQLSDPVTLPSGLILQNRLAKAAMNEGLGGIENLPDHRIIDLYRRWGKDNWGMLLTGNWNIDRKYLCTPTDIHVPSESELPKSIETFKAFAAAGQAHGGAVIVQISHPGRQSPMGAGSRGMLEKTIAPSAIPVNLGSGYLASAVQKISFGTPKGMTLEDIDDVKRKFVWAAKMVAQTGFKGVQIHAAHGYLLSEFVTPNSNQRTDKYGGTAENRIRIVLEIIEEARKVAPKGFTIGVKLNSVDQQTASDTDMEDALKQVELLEKAGIDFLEISGGSYEDPSFTAKDGEKPYREISSRTLAREAFFLEFASTLRKEFPNIMLLVTGGFRTRAGMKQAIEEDATDLIGIGRPACLATDVANKILDPNVPDDDAKFHLNSIRHPWLVKQLGVQILTVGRETGYYLAQIQAMSEGKPTKAP